MSAVDRLLGRAGRLTESDQLARISELLGCSLGVFAGDERPPLELEGFVELQDIWHGLPSDHHRQQLLALARTLLSQR